MQPFEPQATDEGGRARIIAGDDVEERADADHERRSETWARLGDPGFLAGIAERDKDNIGACLSECAAPR